MATLNTLRTKFGIVLSAVIAIALLAFVFSLKSEMGFSGNDPIVAVIDGEKVSYSEYIAEYENIKSMSGIDESSEQQIASLESAAMQSFVSSKVVEPGLEAMGIGISEEERMAIIRGDIPTQAFYSVFADPSTGAYDSNGVAMFLLQAGGNAQAEAMWSFINKQARTEREVTKYITLLGAGAYINDLEVKEGVASANNRYAGRWASKRYSTLADSLFTVTPSEVKSYYEANKSRYKKDPSRSLAYVTFNIVATDEDKSAIEAEATKAGEEFAVTTDIRAYVRENRYGSIGETYQLPTQLLEDEAKAFDAGEQYGPVLRANTWRISRPVATRMAPDSIGIRLIALPYTSMALADSLTTALQGGADFALAAAQHSMHAESAQDGGDVGMVPYSVFATDIADALEGVKNNSVVKIEVGDMIQILKVYNVGKATKHYRVAAVEYPVIASVATINKAHNDAALFVVDAKGSKDKFDAAATTHAVSVSDVELMQGQREVMGISSSREIARWANNAKSGDVSQIFKTDGGYVVAILTKIDDSRYNSLSSVSTAITAELLKDKKFEAIKADLQGTTLDEAAKSISTMGVRDFSDIGFTSPYVSGMGMEPRVIGAITSTESTGVLSAPIRGNSGLYIFEVTAITQVDEPQDEAAERVRAQAAAEGMMMQMAYQTLREMSNVEDLRGTYF